MVCRLGVQDRKIKMVFNTGGTWRRVTFEKLMIKVYDFFNWLTSCLVSVCNNINENLLSLRFLFILLQTETKQLSRLKKSYIFIISFWNVTRRQVPPVLKPIFIFLSWTPTYSTSLHTHIVYRTIFLLFTLFIDLFFCFVGFGARIFGISSFGWTFWNDIFVVFHERRRQSGILRHFELGQKSNSTSESK